MSKHPVVPILSQLLKRDLSTPEAVRERLRRSVLTLDEALVYGRGPEREALAESDDPVERACADNPGMIAEIRAQYPEPDEFAEALEGSRVLVSEDSYPGDTIAEADTLKRIVAAVALCRFNQVALHALAHHFWVVDEPLALMRVSIDRLRMEPDHASARLLAAQGAAELEWHAEAVALLEPVVDRISVGLSYNLVGSVHPLFVRSLLLWVNEHIEARQPGLVGGRMLSTGEMVVSPFDRVRSALAVFEAHLRREADPSALDDLARLKRMYAVVFSNAVMSGRAPVEDLERARTVLGVHGIEVTEDSGLSIHVRYQKAHWTNALHGQLARLEEGPEGWELTPLALPYFWGDDWRGKPGTVVFESLRDLVHMVVEALVPRMSREQILQV